MSIPTNPGPVDGTVPWNGVLCRIKHRKPHPVLGWLYTLHEQRPGAPLVIWCNITQQDVVEAMKAIARHATGSYVDLGPLHRRRILGRKWSFEHGQFYYLVEGARAGRAWSIAEDELEQRIRAAVEEHA